MKKEEFVILVNDRDEAIGTMEKLEAHERGVLHRAFSVLMFNNNNEMLIQQRASDKYHCPNLWANACCSHQREHETTHSAAQRRLMEELGMTCEVQDWFKFLYEVKFDNGLTEHELDHVVKATYNGDFSPNPQEVQSVRWISQIDLQMEMAQNPSTFAPWFRIIMDRINNGNSN